MVAGRGRFNGAQEAVEPVEDLLNHPATVCGNVASVEHDVSLVFWRRSQQVEQYLLGCMHGPNQVVTTTDHEGRHR